MRPAFRITADMGSLEGPRIVELPEQYFLVVRGTMRDDEIGSFFGPAFEKIGARLAQLGVNPASAPMTHYLNPAGPIFDMAAAFRIATPVAGEGDVESLTVPPTRAVAIDHVGPYPELGDAYTAAHSWIAKQGLAALGDSWEEYLVGPGQGAPEAYLTRLYLPLRSL